MQDWFSGSPLASGRRAEPRFGGIVLDLGMRTAGRLAVGLDHVLGARSKGLAGILTYHRISPRFPGLPRPLYNVEPERFREQLVGLRRRGYTFWTLRRLLDHHGEPVPERVVVVTFDDGYQSVHAHAWPVLRQLEIPATVFLCTAFLDSDGALPFDAWGTTHERSLPPVAYRALTTAQCVALAHDGLVELGSHTHTHRDFRSRRSEFAGDLRRSVDLLKDRFGEVNVPFAFPYGTTHRGFADATFVEEARRTGVTCGLTMDAALVDPMTDPWGWGRFNVFPWDTSATLAGKLSGWYSWAPRTWQRIGSIMRR